MSGGFSQDGRSRDGNRKDMKNDRWTRVLTMDQVLIVGFNEHKLEDDLDEAWKEIENVKHLASELWAPLFNPKEYEEKGVSTDIEDYRLSSEDLEELGKHVAKLRNHVQLRVSAIQHDGDAVEVQAIPPEISQGLLEARAERHRLKVLAEEVGEVEALEKPASHKYRRRKFHELSSAELVGIGHAIHIGFRFRRDVAE